MSSNLLVAIGSKWMQQLVGAANIWLWAPPHRKLHLAQSEAVTYPK